MFKKHNRMIIPRNQNNSYLFIDAALYRAIENNINKKAFPSIIILTVNSLQI